MNRGLRRAEQRIDRILRFIRLVSFPKNLDDCWLWTGATVRGGYGRMRFAGQFVMAHRVAWILYRETAVPAAIIHRCDVHGCVNPSHLAAETGGEHEQVRRSNQT